MRESQTRSGRNPRRFGSNVSPFCEGGEAKGKHMNRLRVGRWILMAVLFLTFSTASFAQVFVSVRIGPPALPVYAQPLCPGSGYIWTPGYWAWNDDEGY